MLLITKILCHCKSCFGNTHTRSGRLVHLSENKRRFVDNAGLFHFVPKVVTFTRTLTYTGENRIAAVLCCDIGDKLLNKNGFTNAGTAEQADFTAL